MTRFLFLIFILHACTPAKQSPDKMIIGRWAYVTAERLGDGSQNDSALIAAFDQNMKGKFFIFNGDGTCKAVLQQDTSEVVMQEGKYTIARDGQSMQIFNQEITKIALTDSVFKLYSPNNGTFIWRKVKL